MSLIKIQNVLSKNVICSMLSFVLSLQCVKDGNNTLTWGRFYLAIFVIKYRTVRTSNMHQNLFWAAIETKYISQGCVYFIFHEICTLRGFHLMYCGLTWCWHRATQHDSLPMIYVLSSGVHPNKLYGYDIDYVPLHTMYSAKDLHYIPWYQTDINVLW